MRRAKRLHLNDPRCYDGAYYDAEWVWGSWEVLESMQYLKPGTDPEERLKFWRELNDYAVSQRGESARCELKLT
jgi:hypothetical protein